MENTQKEIHMYTKSLCGTVHRNHSAVHLKHRNHNLLKKNSIHISLNHHCEEKTLLPEVLA